MSFVLEILDTAGLTKRPFSVFHHLRNIANPNFSMKIGDGEYAALKE